MVQVEHVVDAYKAGYCAAGDINELDFLSYKDYLVISSLVDRLASYLVIPSLPDRLTSYLVIP